jgi:hypothetical protein
VNVSNFSTTQDTVEMNGDNSAWAWASFHTPSPSFAVESFSDSKTKAIVTGTAVYIVGINSANGFWFSGLGVCYGDPSGNYAITEVGTQISSEGFNATGDHPSASVSVTVANLPPGTYAVGLCVRREDNVEHLSASGTVLLAETP